MTGGPATSSTSQSVSLTAGAWVDITNAVIAPIVSTKAGLITLTLPLQNNGAAAITYLVRLYDVIAGAALTGPASSAIQSIAAGFFGNVLLEYPTSFPLGSKTIKAQISVGSGSAVSGVVVATDYIAGAGFLMTYTEAAAA